MRPFHRTPALRRTSAAATLLAASLSAACADVEAPVAPAAATPEAAVVAGPGKIAFVSYRTGNGEIFIMNGDGSGTPVNITNDPADDRTPAWSPDGSRIAFSSTRGGTAPDVYVMNADGSGVVRLSNALVGQEPTWSPDGKRVAFSGFDGTSSDIYVVNANGTGLQKLTPTAGANEYHPSWAPRGGRIAYSRREWGSANSDIYTMGTDGSRSTRLTTDPARDMEPAWSPDGRRIAFVSNRGTSGYDDLFVMDARGRRQTPITAQIAAKLPAWSPAGDRISFTDETAYLNPEVAVVKADGTGYVNLTNSPAFDGEPSWAR